jgi:hypothetical protein
MEQEHQEYKGHRIELRRAPEAAALRAGEVERESQPELLIDGAQIDYGQFPNGTYFRMGHIFYANTPTTGPTT